VPLTSFFRFGIIFYGGNKNEKTISFFCLCFLTVLFFVSCGEEGDGDTDKALIPSYLRMTYWRNIEGSYVSFDDTYYVNFQKAGLWGSSSFSAIKREEKGGLITIYLQKNTGETGSYVVIKDRKPEFFVRDGDTHVYYNWSKITREEWGQ
jgi:hypothetical protein